MKRSSTFKGTLVLGVLASGTGALVQFICMPLASRILGTSRLAELYTLLAISTLFGTPALGLFPTLVGRLCSDRELSDRVIRARTIISLSLCSALVLTLVVSSVGFLHHLVWPNLEAASVIVAMSLGALSVFFAPFEALQASEGGLYRQYTRTALANVAIVLMIVAWQRADVLGTLSVLGVIVGTRVLASALNSLQIVIGILGIQDWSFRFEGRGAMSLAMESLFYTGTNSLGSWLCYGFPLVLLRGVVAPVEIAMLGALLMFVSAWLSVAAIGAKTLQSFAKDSGSILAPVGFFRRVRLLVVAGVVGGVCASGALVYGGDWLIRGLFHLAPSHSLLETTVLSGVYILFAGLEEILYSSCIVVRPARSLGPLRLMKGLVVAAALVLGLKQGGFSPLLFWGSLIGSSMLLSLVSGLILVYSARRQGEHKQDGSVSTQ